MGDLWECGDLDVYQERRGCEVCNRLIHELRRLLPEPLERPQWRWVDLHLAISTNPESAYRNGISGEWVAISEFRLRLAVLEHVISRQEAHAEDFLAQCLVRSR